MAGMGAGEIIDGVCCECGRVRSSEGVWVRLPVLGLLQAVTVVRDGELVEYRVSHGLCPSCHAAYLLEMLGSRARTAAGGGGGGDAARVPGCDMP